jgi:hypothetical protein
VTLRLNDRSMNTGAGGIINGQHRLQQAMPAPTGLTKVKTLLFYAWSGQC